MSEFFSIIGLILLLAAQAAVAMSDSGAAIVAVPALHVVAMMISVAYWFRSSNRFLPPGEHVAYFKPSVRVSTIRHYDTLSQENMLCDAITHFNFVGRSHTPLDVDRGHMPLLLSGRSLDIPRVITPSELAALLRTLLCSER